MSQLTSEADPADHFVSAERALGSVTCHHVNDWLTNDDVDKSEVGFINCCSLELWTKPIICEMSIHVHITFTFRT